MEHQVIFVGAALLQAEAQSVTEGDDGKVFLVGFGCHPHLEGQRVAAVQLRGIASGVGTPAQAALRVATDVEGGELPLQVGVAAVCAALDEVQPHAVHRRPRAVTDVTRDGAAGLAVTDGGEAAVHRTVDLAVRVIQQHAVLIVAAGFHIGVLEGIFRVRAALLPHPGPVTGHAVGDTTALNVKVGGILTLLQHGPFDDDHIGFGALGDIHGRDAGAGGDAALGQLIAEEGSLQRGRQDAVVKDITGILGRFIHVGHLRLGDIHIQRRRGDALPVGVFGTLALHDEGGTRLADIVGPFQFDTRDVRVGNLCQLDLHIALRGDVQRVPQLRLEPREEVGNFIAFLIHLRGQEDHAVGIYLVIIHPGVTEVQVLCIAGESAHLRVGGVRGSFLLAIDIPLTFITARIGVVGGVVLHLCLGRPGEGRRLVPLGELGGRQLLGIDIGVHHVLAPCATVVVGVVPGIAAAGNICFQRAPCVDRVTVQGREVHTGRGVGEVHFVLVFTALPAIFRGQLVGVRRFDLRGIGSTVFPVVERRLGVTGNIVHLEIHVPVDVPGAGALHWHRGIVDRQPFACGFGDLQVEMHILGVSEGVTPQEITEIKTDGLETAIHQFRRGIEPIEMIFIGPFYQTPLGFIVLDFTIFIIVNGADGLPRPSFVLSRHRRDRAHAVVLIAPFIEGVPLLEVELIAPLPLGIVKEALGVELVTEFLHVVIIPVLSVIEEIIRILIIIGIRGDFENEFSVVGMFLCHLFRL